MKAKEYFDNEDHHPPHFTRLNMVYDLTKFYVHKKLFVKVWFKSRHYDTFY